MKNDIIPPKLPRPVGQPQEEPSVSLPEPESLSTSFDQAPPTPQAEEPSARPKSKRPPLKLIILGIVGIVLLLVVVAAGWYVAALRPVDPADTSRERIVVEPGSSLATVGNLLEKKDLIRNRSAFTLLARITGAGAKLQAGTYSLSRSESASAILSHFTSGKVDQFTITFLPGVTLRKLQGETRQDGTDIKSVLLKAGYEDDEIEAAFAKRYDHPLFTDKPAGADLEGYVFGETYTFSGNATVEQILEETFDEHYKVIEENNLIAGYKAQGLSLYEGITLASIIQREVTSPEDQKQVAQVFLTRLKQNISLGADPTYQYAAKKLGVPPSPDLDSPYNTRKFAGLPPGPIASPGAGALKAVASPLPGDYLFFVSGDDNVTYFARTMREHEANVVKYCQKKCSVY